MLSDNIKNLRKAKGLSQDELAVKLNVVRQTVSKWEKGLSVPDSEMLIRIAEALETSVNVLLSETIEPDVNSELKMIANKLEIINEQIVKYNESRRKTWRMVFVILAVVTACVLARGVAEFLHLLSVMDSNPSTSIIGGADAPTAVYISSIIFKPLPFTMTVIAAIVAAVGIYKTRKYLSTLHIRKRNSRKAVPLLM